MARETKLEEIETESNPFPHYVKEEIIPVKKIKDVPHLGTVVSTAGRIISIRPQGGIMFFHLLDDDEKIQCVLMKNLDKEKFKHFKKYFDIGDLVWVKGELFYTKRGELSIKVLDFQMAAKTLRDLPGKYGHGMKDPELRYRKRHLDLLLNPTAFKNFKIKFEMIKEIRKFLWAEDFIEVETPILQPVYGGAAATPFTTKIKAIDEEWFMRISPELYLKRYIIGGFNKVFEIGKQFRNEDIDVTHNPEFTTIEIYQAWADYNDMMRLTEKMFYHLAKKVLGTTKIKYTMNGEEKEIDLTPPWKRLPMLEAIKQYCDIDVTQLSDDEIKKILEEKDAHLKGKYNRDIAIAKIFEKCVEEHLIQPTFITDFPRATSPLTKLHRDKEGLIERFELYIAGMELANAYTELNDPRLQRKFFEEAAERLKSEGEEGHPYDWEFVEALEHGMPPTGGIGIGIDRLAMLFTNNLSIKEVIPFPIQKRMMKEPDA